MSVFVVSYELKNEVGSAAYRPLWDALERLTSHKVQRSLWLVSWNGTPFALQNHLKPYIDEDDRIWISRVHRNEAAYSGAIAGTKKFLADHL